MLKVARDLACQTTLLMGIALAASFAGFGQAVDPGDIRRRVDLKGGDAVLDELYDDEVVWDAVLNGVASGTDEWIDVANQLIPWSDAGS